MYSVTGGFAIAQDGERQPLARLHQRPDEPIEGRVVAGPGSLDQIGPHSEQRRVTHGSPPVRRS